MVNQLSEKNPVDRAFFESLILRDRWNVGKLYASNMFHAQRFRRKLKHMEQERACSLFGIDQDIEDMKKKIEDIIIDRNNLTYLPTQNEMEYLNRKRRQNVQVKRDPKNSSVLVLPPIVQSSKQQNHRQQKTNKKLPKKPNGTQKKVRKPLHEPKQPRSKVFEIPRRTRYRHEYEAVGRNAGDDEENNMTTKSSHTVPSSVLQSYPDSVRMYYPSTETSAIGRSPFTFGSLYGDTSFKKKSTYKDFYREEDFKATTPKYISRSIRANKEGMEFLHK